MKRWNGWGDTAIDYPLASSAIGFLADRIGTGVPPRDASFEMAVAKVPPSRLPASALYDISPAARLTASFGQSLPDWLRLRFGEVGAVVDAVAFPESSEDVRALINWAAQVNAVLLPCGGATSVVGHLTPPAGDRPVVSVQMRRMSRLLELDTAAALARFEAGVIGPDLEAQLRAQGYTLGHFPQSFEYSTLGGWVVTRSSGQQSLRYGRIEQLFAGGRLETPVGPLDLPTIPASAAGPDLREWVLGSEGRLGILTEATVRVSRLPECERFDGIFFPDWDSAATAVRELAQLRPGLSMLRLSNAIETETTLRLAGHPELIGWLERYLRLRGCGEGKCLLLAGVTGERLQVAAARRLLKKVTGRHGGVGTGSLIGKRWAKNRFRGVYLRNTLWDAGYLVDTVETACDWPRVKAMQSAIEAAGRNALAGFGEKVHCYTHLSHVYAQGSSVYSTFCWRIAPTFAENIERWTAVKTEICRTIVQHGGTISHQHGVGKDHAAYLGAEKGPLGLSSIDALIRNFDPDGVFATGNLLLSPNFQAAE